MPSILVVDDEPGLRQVLTLLLERLGHEVTVAATAAEAGVLLDARTFDVALLDLTLPDGSGLDLLRRIVAADATTPCILITAFGSIPSAVEAIRAGGFDYITKPFDNDALLVVVKRALEMRRLGVRVRELERDLEAREAFPGIIGRSTALSESLRALDRVARSDTVVLLRGESGVGKELAARFVHRRSSRARGPFVAVNCSAIPVSLAESELFGHERGAFTDAKEARAGKFGEAAGGTLFLDEVGDLPLEVQAKTLRALQDRTVQRLGARQSSPIDVRIIAATNRDLEAGVRAGTFREDLYWRLNAFPVRLPPLRERIGDLKLLTDHILDRLNSELGTDIAGISEQAMQALERHSWPGNVRELENVLKRAVILSDGPMLDKVDLAQLGHGSGVPPTSDASDEDETLETSTRRAVEHIERQRIQQALAKHKGNREETARALGISRRTLFTKIGQYRISVDETKT
jgi:DNA-binding NtrC family response regulator